MLPAYVRDPEHAVLWLRRWLDRLGASSIEASADAVETLEEPSGALAEIRVAANAHFGPRRRLEITVLVDAQLTARYYTFDLIDAGQRRWGWHGHEEPVGFHHRHEPPDFAAVACAPVTFEAVERRLHES